MIRIAPDARVVRNRRDPGRRGDHPGRGDDHERRRRKTRTVITGPRDSPHRDMDEARRLITGLAGLVTASAEYLGPHAGPLRDGLTGLQRRSASTAPIPDEPGAGPGEKHTGPVEPARLSHGERISSRLMIAIATRPSSRLSWVPAAAGWIVGIIATLSLLASLFPFLRVVIKDPAGIHRRLHLQLPGHQLRVGRRARIARRRAGGP